MIEYYKLLVIFVFKKVVDFRLCLKNTDVFKKPSVSECSQIFFPTNWGARNHLLVVLPGLGRCIA